jgi:hypothetical protein
LTGQGGEWSPSNAQLRKNLDRVVRYALKGLLKSARDVPPSFCLVASGALRSFRRRILWRIRGQNKRRHIRRTPGKRPETQRDAGTCGWCGGPMGDKRADARWCSRSCRTLASRHRTRCMAALPDAVRDTLRRRARERAAAEGIAQEVALDALLREQSLHEAAERDDPSTAVDPEPPF